MADLRFMSPVQTLLPARPLLDQMVWRSLRRPYSPCPLGHRASPIPNIPTSCGKLFGRRLPDLFRKSRNDAELLLSFGEHAGKPLGISLRLCKLLFKLLVLGEPAETFDLSCKRCIPRRQSCCPSRVE